MKRVLVAIMIAVLAVSCFADTETQDRGTQWRCTAVLYNPEYSTLPTPARVYGSWKSTKAAAENNCRDRLFNKLQSIFGEMEGFDPEDMYRFEFESKEGSWWQIWKGEGQRAEIDSILSEFHLVYIRNGKEVEKVASDQIVPGQHVAEYEKQIAPILKGNYDTQMLGAIADEIGCEASELKVKERFVHEQHCYKDNTCEFFKRSVKNGKVVLEKLEIREQAQRGYTVYVKVIIDGNTYNYGEWSTFETMEEAEDACGYVKYGEGKKEVRNWAMAQAGFPDTDSIRIVTTIK